MKKLRTIAQIYYPLFEVSIPRTIASYPALRGLDPPRCRTNPFVWFFIHTILDRLNRVPTYYRDTPRSAKFHEFAVFF